MTVSDHSNDGVFLYFIGLGRNINFTAYGNGGNGIDDHYPEGNIHINLTLSNNGLSGFSNHDGCNTSVVNAKSYNNGDNGFNFFFTYGPVAPPPCWLISQRQTM